MRRIVFSASLAASIALMAWQPLAAQPVQYQFTPPPPITPLPQTGVSAPVTPPGVAEPVPSPGIARVEPQTYTPPGSVKPLRSHAPRFVWSGRRMIPVPPASRHASYGDRVQGCVQAGAAAGVPSGRLGSFGARCAAQ